MGTERPEDGGKETDLTHSPFSKLLRSYAEWKRERGPEHEGTWALVHPGGVTAGYESAQEARDTARGLGLDPGDCLAVRVRRENPAISAWGA